MFSAFHNQSPLITMVWGRKADRSLSSYSLSREPSGSALPVDPTILGNESAHFSKNNTNNNNELIKENNKFLTGFQLKTPRLKVLVIGYLPIGWNWRASLPSWQTQKGERGGGRGVKSKREQGNGEPSLSFNTLPNSLFFPTLFSMPRRVRVFTPSFEEVC